MQHGTTMKKIKICSKLYLFNTRAHARTHTHTHTHTHKTDSCLFSSWKGQNCVTVRYRVSTPNEDIQICRLNFQLFCDMSANAALTYNGLWIICYQTGWLLRPVTHYPHVT
jgi:hypothetical protein